MKDAMRFGALGDYVPPTDIEAEQATLGSMLIETQAVEAAAALLTRFDFYRPGHSVIFETILSVFERGEPVEMMSIHRELDAAGRLETIGGLPYLAALFDHVASAANVGFYAAKVKECGQRRRLIEAALETIGLARSKGDDIAAVIAHAEMLVAAVSEGRCVEGSELLREPLMRIYDQAEASAEMGGLMTGLRTGFDRFDAMTGGLQKTDLVIVAARPSMGKTSLALSIAEHVAIRENKPVLIFSLEMDSEQLARRMVCSRAEVSSHLFRSGRLPLEDMTRVQEYYKKSYLLPIHIDGRTETTPSMMRQECRRVQRAGGLAAVVVDYLQLVRCDRRIESRREEVTEIIKRLKSLAREFKVPLVVLSQLSRKVEERQNKRPILSDLYESGGIEAEADLVCMLYREAYYAHKEQFGEGRETAGPPTLEETELIIAKHRNGPTGMIKLGFIPQFAKFDNLEVMPDGSTGY